MVRMRDCFRDFAVAVEGPEESELSVWSWGIMGVWGVATGLVGWEPRSAVSTWRLLPFVSLKAASNDASNDFSYECTESIVLRRSN